MVSRRGEAVAYARTIEEGGRSTVIELARAPAAAAELASLLCTLAPTADPLLCPGVPDPELRTALAARTHVAEGADTEAMWCMIDRSFLQGLSDLPEGAPDELLIQSLVGGPAGVYWPADRF